MECHAGCHIWKILCKNPLAKEFEVHSIQVTSVKEKSISGCLKSKKMCSGFDISITQRARTAQVWSKPQEFHRTLATDFSEGSLWLFISLHGYVKKFLTQNAANRFNFIPCQLFNSCVSLFQKMNINNVFICLFDKYAWMLNNLYLKLTCQGNHDTNIMMKHYSALKMNFCNSHNWPLGCYWLMKQYFNRNLTNLCVGLHIKIYIFYYVQIHLANHQQNHEGCRLWLVLGPETC